MWVTLSWKISIVHEYNTSSSKLIIGSVSFDAIYRSASKQYTADAVVVVAVFTAG